MYWIYSIIIVNFIFVFFHLSSQLHEVQKKIGYCPQFDAIIELLTGRELLIMFARLRGIPERHIKSAVQFEIDRLDLKQHANKRCGNYRYCTCVYSHSISSYSCVSTALYSATLELLITVCCLLFIYL